MPDLGQGLGWVNPSNNFMITPDGGIAVPLVSGEGATTILRGELVTAHSTSGQVLQSTADNAMPIGVAHANIAPGGTGWIIITGRAKVRLKNSTAATAGQWVRMSATAAGRVDTAASPPGGGIPELDAHQRECGHCLESALDTDASGALVYAIVHFN
jgi:hypothetical protein